MVDVIIFIRIANAQRRHMAVYITDNGDASERRITQRLNHVGISKLV